LRLSLDLEFLLAKYFDDKIKSIRELNVIRDRLKFIKTCSTEEAFILVDQNKNGYISTLEEIDNFLRKNGKQLNKDELNRIYRNLTNQTFGEITY
jgi:Ca2+-binding EF-hand superfamily protein